MNTPTRPWKREQTSSLLKLSSDVDHKPKTTGSFGILVIGLGGANGCTMLAGVLANRNKLKWYGPHGEGPIDANYFGCISQIPERGIHGGVGYKGKIHGLSDANLAAIGGWDIRPTKLGDALFEAQILDYDLVKQVRDEMNAKFPIFKGYYDPRFIGSSQHGTATHILSKEEAPNATEAVKCIRADIRYFKWKNGVVGHTTVIWSASVEPNSEFCMDGGGLDTAQDLLRSISMTDEERGGPLPPSLLYATAAIMEGCSFVNGGSQNTICKGLTDLAKQQLGVYCLGTDFKAGQTKFKTAAVEYLRTMGLTPKVIASSNHLGNNDMHNLATGDAARKAKLRVKHDIFAAWEEDIDHKVSVMYTPMINDEKRDFVEYTSLGFLSQHHTMVTYTRASDSVLCVPLMIDAAVWIDFFSRKSWSYENVAKALAYLFKVPEGAAKGVDPGFFRQMQELDKQLLDASESSTGRKKNTSLNEMNSTKRVVKFKEKKTEFFTEWRIPNDIGVICAGLACVDMQLLGATGGDGGESIETFQGEKSMGGGSVSMACKNLSRLCHLDPLEDVYMQVTPPVVSSIVPLCKMGFDTAGNNLVNFLESVGDLSKNIETRYMKNARSRDPNARTALAVLPIYQDGRRGCFFDAASNATFSASELVDMMEEAYNNEETPFGAFLFGYPHLLPNMQGEALAHIFSRARSLMENGGLVVLDLNGVPESEKQITPFGSMCSASTLADDPVIGPALSHTDILHLNEEELTNLTGVSFDDNDEKKVNDSISKAASLFLQCGVAVVAVTRGKKGCYIKCNDETRFSSSKMLPSSWIDKEIQVEASILPPGAEINSNGAGDAFTSGLLVAAMLRHTGLVENPIETNSPTKDSVHEDCDIDSNASIGTMSPKKLTPYTLYMKENYMVLKAQYSEDKTVLFSKCNEMWEEESDEVKELYRRKCEEEIERLQKEPPSIDTLKDDYNDSAPIEPAVDLHLANQPMTLETAAQFASLVAARHVDMSSRDAKYLNINRIREASSVSSYGLEEI